MGVCWFLACFVVGRKVAVVELMDVIRYGGMVLVFDSKSVCGIERVVFVYRD